MSKILYSVIARGDVPLVDSGSPNIGGNFNQTVNTLLKQVNSHINDRKSLLSGDFAFHFVVTDGITYLAAADVTIIS